MCNPARDYYHFMYYRWIPLFSSLTLTGLTGGLWGYAWESTAPAPTWVPASVLVLAFLFAAIGAIGIVFASKTTASKAAKNYLPDRDDAVPCGIRFLLCILPTYHYKHFWVYSSYSRFNSRESSRGLPLPGWFPAKVNISLLSGRGKRFAYLPTGEKPLPRW